MIYLSRLLRLYPILMQGPDVLEIQQRLLKLGYTPGIPDGIVGPITMKTINFAHDIQNNNTQP